MKPEHREAGHLAGLRSHLWLLGILLCCFPGSPPARAAEPAGSRPWLTAAIAVVGDAGICNGAILLSDKLRPVAWVGLNKRPGQKTRYAYLLLFPPDAPAGLTFTFDKVHVTQHEAAGTLKCIANGKTFTVTYEFKANPRTGRAVSEKLILDERTLAAEDPRVYLLDLSADEAGFIPVDVKLPDVVPDVTQGKAQWTPAVLTAIAKLKEQSPQIAEFLDSSE